MTCATRTTCPYCGVGCGVIAEPGQDEIAIKGDPDHPANFGRLCSKGSALGETLDLKGRLLHPKINGQRADWDTALDLVANTFSALIDQYGPDSVAFYGSGQLLTEDYYVANKLMKGFIGSANIDTNSRLCMASSVVGHKRAFGTDTVPGTYEDLEQADLLVLVGSNLAWCHPVLYQRIAAAKQARPTMRVVTVDPRRTATTELADLHLGLRPDTDVALFNGLLQQIASKNLINHDYVDSHVAGHEEALAAAGQSDPAITGIEPWLLEQFYSWWTGTERVVTVFSQGVNQSASGSDKVNAIINCHLATGRIGRPGMGPFSVTGQPNAMGGREVGGLANMLACHLALENPDHRAAVQTFWQSKTIASQAGLKAVDLFNACRDGKIKALWVMATNPAVSMPNADAVRDAIKNVPFVVTSDIEEKTDTTALAHVLLPAAGWGEKSGTVTNSERRISRQRAFLPLPGEARPDWKILSDVACRMGWQQAFAFESPADVFREHAALSGVAADLGVDFDISDLTDISDADYETLAPRQWPNPNAETRFFAEGGFYTDDRRGRMLPVAQKPVVASIADDYPLVLNTGRVRDHWHTMTRTARSPRLNQHIAEPYAEIHPKDAAKYNVGDADLISVESAEGRAVVRALVTDRVDRGSIFVPMHWTGQYSSDGRIGATVAPDTDPFSGQPALKFGRVRLSPFKAAWYGFAVCAKRPNLDSSYWALGRVRGGWRAELAGLESPEDWEGFARSLFGTKEGETVTLIDKARSIARVAIVDQGRVLGALFTDSQPVAVGRSHVIAALREATTAQEMLAGRPGSALPDPGRIICSCFEVGLNTIVNAIEQRGLVDVDAIGKVLNAGTNCGSCRPEIQGLLETQIQQQAAE